MRHAHTREVGKEMDEIIFTLKVMKFVHVNVSSNKAFRVTNLFEFARIKFNRNCVSLYTIQWRKLILITKCYENRSENWFSDSRWICRPSFTPTPTPWNGGKFKTQENKGKSVLMLLPVTLMQQNILDVLLQSNLEFKVKVCDCTLSPIKEVKFHKWTKYWFTLCHL